MDFNILYIYMGLTFGKTVDNYTQWVDGPKLSAPKRRISKSKSNSHSYKSAKSRSSSYKSLKKHPSLPFVEGEDVYGLKKKSKKSKKKSKKSKKKSNVT